MHDEYKNLVDFMLGSYMEEMQITPEQFEVACLEGRNNYGNSENPLSLHNGLFQQIWAANDIRIFIKMLTQRNLEIQLQALDLIERRQMSSTSNGSNDGDDVEPVVTNESLYNDGKVSEIDLQDDEVVLSTMQIIENKLREEKLAAQMETVNTSNTNIEPTSETETNSSDDKFKRLNLFFENDKIDDEQVKQRQEYLRAQRDRILHLKKQARARQLNETAKKTDRPKSAHVAQKLLADRAFVIGEANKDASLQLRKMLAQRLKTEVVDGAGADL